MKVRVSIDTQTFVKLALVFLAFVVGVYMLVLARQPLMIIGLSLFLALALNPPVSAISRRMPGRSRIGATAVAYILVLSILGLVTILVAPPVIEQSTKFAQTVPGLIDEVAESRVYFQDFIDRYGLNEAYNNAVESAKNQASAIAADLGNIIVNGAGSVLSDIVTLLIIVVLAFLMLIEGPTWLKLIWGLYQDQRLLDRHRDVVNKMYRVVTGFVNGQIIIASIAGLSTLVVLVILSAIFDFPTNISIPLAVIVAITGFIPMIGATLGAVLVSLILILNSVPAMIVFVVFFIIYQQIENNFISPVVQSKTVDLSALMVLSAVLIGVSIFGLIGGIISIPIAGCIRVLLVDYIEHAERKRNMSVTKNPLKRVVQKATK